MSIRTKGNIIRSHVASIYIALMATGLVLLILAHILLIEMIDFDQLNQLTEYLVFIFMLIFAILGLGIITIGTFGALKYLLKKKEIQVEIREEKHSGISTAQAGRGGLQIIRGSMPSKSEETVSRSEEVEVTKPSPKKEVEVKKSVKTKPSEFPEDFSYEDGLQSIVDRYKTEKVKKAFKNWYNTLMITFPDISKSYLFKIEGQEGLDFSEGLDEEAAVQVKMDSTMFVKMMTKQINPIKAYSSGNLEVKGEMKNMLKLRKLMF